MSTAQSLESPVELVKFVFDPRCRWSYLPARWLHRLEELGVLELDWGLFSLEVLHLAVGDDPLELQALSGPALRTAIAIRDLAGSRAIGRFYFALGKRIWEQAPQARDLVLAVRESLAEIGFDPSLVDQALQDPTTWEAVLVEHRHLLDSTRSFGVPTIVLDGGNGPAIFGPVIGQMPDDETALELWRHVSWLARYEDFSELKRTRSSEPNLAGVTWREQHEGKKHRS